MTSPNQKTISHSKDLCYWCAKYTQTMSDDTKIPWCQACAAKWKKEYPDGDKHSIEEG